MKFLELALQRKSLRKYEPRPVDREILQRCLQAAQHAPSACNSQPWFFIVVDDPILKEKLCQAAFSGIYQMNGFAANAPIIVAVVRENMQCPALIAGLARGVQYALFDLGIACEHFILQAQEDGVGACVLGWFNESGVKKVLNLPRAKKVDMLISLGYPAEDGTHSTTRKTLDQISRFNV